MRASKQIKAIFLAIVGFSAMAGPCRAGVYSSIDADVEVDQFSRNFDVFGKVLLDLQAVAFPEGGPNPPIRQRYVLLEKLFAKQGPANLSIEQKLNLSTVLIRRGKVDEAIDLLKPLSEDNPDNFVIMSQLATAQFLGTPEQRANALDYMKEALSKWPEKWTDLNEDQAKFLRSIHWEETRLAKFRSYDKYLERLIRHRLAEDNKRKKKEAVKDAVDPIFGDDKALVSFVNDKGEFEVGRIMHPDLQRLPQDADVVAQQLLLWMPHDERLLWLLGEVLNARASSDTKKRSEAIRNAGLVFKRLDDIAFNRSGMYGRKDIKERYDAINQYVKDLPPNPIDPRLQNIIDKAKDEEEGSLLENKIFWRALIVGVVTGVAVGMFALWQIQEMRRRRQANQPT